MYYFYEIMVKVDQQFFYIGSFQLAGQLINPGDFMTNVAKSNLSLSPDDLYRLLNLSFDITQVS